MMISASMNSKLNEQVAAELSAAHAYLAMACSLESMGLKILTKWFLAQHNEEREHAMKIVTYIQEVGGKVVLGAVPAPASDYANVEAIVAAALESEQMITRMIHDLVARADKESDYATRSFLNFFVDEQVEEVASMTDLLDLVRLAGDNILEVESRIRHQMVSKS
jgi:ferritin